MIRRLLSLVLVLAVSACGFHLRDALTLPVGLDPVKVVSPDRYSPLAETLAQALTRAGATPATPDTQSPAVLELLAEQWGSTPVSVDERGRAQEYSLRYAVVFELRNGDGTVLVPMQNIELSRDYISVPEASIGTEGERDILERELRREMAAAVLRRIDAASSQGRVVDDVDAVFAQPTDAARAAMEAAEAMAPAEAGNETPSPEPAPDPTPR
ncbi:LPS assembly lipoprotein LptE [Novilysobacter spongiicola]|uniref:LPS-assembly lipoprotein LptE n=1 Tax=Lysobacter spongiicola DSM 21749 TaxID=1122188 RepID=A0A1T4N4A0_9GAMM|nr:LPS assembly lipoprotein LptE [Lysobacter spongiicola]SJZ74073.1 LPS-assembly lipoprotein [Lysobacter spongiicola DSM 21749]